MFEVLPAIPMHGRVVVAGTYRVRVVLPYSLNVGIKTASDLFGLLQLIVAVVGIVLALIPLFRTASATRRSVELLSERLIANDLLILLPELTELEDQLDAAVKTAKPDRVGLALLRYSRSIQKVLGHLIVSPTLKEAPIVKMIRDSVDAAKVAKEALYEDPKVDIVDTVRDARKLIAAVVLEAASFSVTLQKGSDSSAS